MNSFIRFRSLGEDFTEENLKKVIAGEKESPERNEKVPDRKEAKPEKRKFDLVVDIQEKMAQGKNGGYVQWAKKYNVKQFAEEPEADSEYMSRQAENALKKLRAIGG